VTSRGEERALRELLGIVQGGRGPPVRRIGAVVGGDESPPLCTGKKNRRTDENAVYLDDLGSMH
jgi:hypothetical protein